MTLSSSGDFGPFEGRVWLNCAHQAPLPNVARAEAEEAVAWKTTPWELTTERFSGVPRRLKQALGRLIAAPADDIILANSASYGLHLIANDFRWRRGDEVLVMRGDFPSDILPWLGLERRGVTVRQLSPRGRVLESDEVEAAGGTHLPGAAGRARARGVPRRRAAPLSAPLQHARRHRPRARSPAPGVSPDGLHPDSLPAGESASATSG